MHGIEVGVQRNRRGNAQHPVEEDIGLERPEKRQRSGSRLAQRDLPAGPRPAKVRFERPDRPDRGRALLSRIEGEADRAGLFLRSGAKEARDVLTHLLLDEGDELPSETAQHAARGLRSSGTAARKSVGSAWPAGSDSIARAKRAFFEGACRRSAAGETPTRAPMSASVVPSKPLSANASPGLEEDLLAGDPCRTAHDE